MVQVFARKSVNLAPNLTAKTVYYYFMELSTIKQAYEAPTVEVVEIKPEGYILQSSKPDYNPIPW